MKSFGNIVLAVLGGIEWAITPLVDGVAKGLDWIIRYFGPVLYPTRSVLLLTAVYLLAVTLTGQGNELILSLPPVLGNEDWIASWLVLLAAMLWAAFQAWWWARTLIDHSFNNDRMTLTVDNRHDLRVLWTPRIYAAIIFVGAGISALTQALFGSAVFIFAVGALMIVFLSVRRKLIGRTGLLSRILAPSLTRPTIGGKEVAGIFAGFTKSGLVILGLSMIAAFAMLILVRSSPVAAGRFFGSLPLTLMAIASIIPVAAIFTIGQQLAHRPILLALLVIALGFSLAKGLDHHEVRALGNDLAARPFANIADAFRQWSELNPGDGPLVLIYSAGGGIRAAYWTADLLATLNERIPEFDRQVFAISGVSGGSVGAMFWAAALPTPMQNDGCFVGSDKLRAMMQQALSADHLAPTLGAMFYMDLLHAFLPIDFGPLNAGDRAVALEESWEASFLTATGQNCLARSFNDLWAKMQPKNWRPILFINGTHQETGRRIITSPVAISDKDFPHSLDFFNLFERKIRASTAALNSARFTYVSPAGRIRSANGIKDQGHVLDGGYFENYGARTMRDLIVALEALQPAERRRRIVLVEIVNDIELNDEDATRAIWENDPKLRPLSWSSYGLINEVRAPVSALMHTRESRGILEAKLIARNLDATTEPRYFQLRLCKVAPPPPLGWLLSKQSREAMDHLIDITSAETDDCSQNFSQQLGSLVAALKSN